MVHKIIGTNIFIQTSQVGINLFNAQEKDIQEYSEILNYIIVLNRKLSNSIESASKESEKRILSHYRKLQDRYAFWLFNILETGEIAKQLFLADNDIAKIIYINQYSISSCKILEKFKYDIGFYNTIFNVDENNAPYKALNCFYDKHYDDLKNIRDKIAAHYDKGKSFVQVNDNIFKDYNADNIGKNLCELYKATREFLIAIQQLSLKFFDDNEELIMRYLKAK